MNLEEIEQKALRYLSQVSNPLVGVDTLRAHLRQEEGLERLSETDLLDFLSHHELFRVIPPPDLAEGGDRVEALSEAGLHMGMYVVLATRVPSDGQLILMMTEQLEMMRDALNAALVEAREAGGSEATADRLREMLRRLGNIQKRLGSTISD